MGTSTLPAVDVGVLGPLEVRRGGDVRAVPRGKPEAVLTMLALHAGEVVSAEALVELLWGDEPPRTAAKALQTHISAIRRVVGEGAVVTRGTGWTLADATTDAGGYLAAARAGRAAAAGGDLRGAMDQFDRALALWRGGPPLPDTPRGAAEQTRWLEAHAALVEDRADAALATGRAAEIVGELEAAVADAPLRERRWGQLMLALYRAGRQGEALRAYQRARALLAEQLGVEPGPDLRRLEAAIVAQDESLDAPAGQAAPNVTRAITFLLTDIEGSTAAWEADAGAMGTALARHDEIVEQVITSRGGRLVKTRGEGDATFSVFDRPSFAAAAAIELQEAIAGEPWGSPSPLRVRVALHTGEAEVRDGDYFGRAVNRAARLRSLAEGGQIVCSGATAELVIDSLPDDVVLEDLGMRELRDLARPEHVFALRLESADDLLSPTVLGDDEGDRAGGEGAAFTRPPLPPVLAGPGPFVGRGDELDRLQSAWQRVTAGGTRAVLVAGEPGVGKTRLAGEWARRAHDDGALVLYGRCDEDLGVPYQPFAEALRSLVPAMGADRVRSVRGAETLGSLVPALTDLVPDLPEPARADPDTERYSLFDAVVGLIGAASAAAPVVLILDDLHWAAKPTLLLLRHLLRFGEHAHVQVVGTYRSTDLDRAHPLAAMLADLHRDGSADRLTLGGLDEHDVSAYVAEAGYDDEELARALASVTAGNPFFLIEALRHVDESGGRWDPTTLPQGVREAVSRRLMRLSPETNDALLAGAVVGSRFSLGLLEKVLERDLVDPLDAACQAGIVIEESGGRYRFNHAIVRQSLLAELASMKRMRLHQRIAASLEAAPGADDELLADLAHHYYECALAGNAAKAFEYCRRAADQAMARLAYEGAADLYDRAVHALDELDDEIDDRDELRASLLLARCEALLAAGDVASAGEAVAALQSTTRGSARLAAWATCFDGQLSMLAHPDRLDEIESAVASAADVLASLDDAAGEAKAHTVRAGCLARLGRIGDCEAALDRALTAARRAGEHRRVTAVLANAPLAALWGPNPVPRAGGRCLDVVRLLRITTGSPAVEATSTRCQAVLEAFRGRAPAARRMVESARRTLTELGLRHGLLEVDLFAGVVELVAGDPAAAEPPLRAAYEGLRRMGLDADAAEAAALLARACLELDRDDEADALCTESERLSGHALKASMAWRGVRAQLLARRGEHAAARTIAEAAVALAEKTDALVDHGDACLALASVLAAAGDAAGARAAAERALALYERKGAAALVQRAQLIAGVSSGAGATPALPPSRIDEERPQDSRLANAAVRIGDRMSEAFASRDWKVLAALASPEIELEDRRRVVGQVRGRGVEQWVGAVRSAADVGAVRVESTPVSRRGDRLALLRRTMQGPDSDAVVPSLVLLELDDGGRLAAHLIFDDDDLDGAMAELEARYVVGEAAPHADVWRSVVDVLEHLNRHELPPSTRDVTSRDHRPASIAPDALGTMVREVWRTTPEWHARHTAVSALDAHGALVQHESRATTPDGIEVEASQLCLLIIRDSLLTHTELFPDDQLDAALARFDELRPRPTLDTLATRMHAQRADAFRARDRTRYAALVAGDCVFEDRRKGFGSGLRGRDAFVENAVASWELGHRTEIETVATRGEFLLLTRRRISGVRDDSFRTELFVLTEINGAGELFRINWFEPDALDAAMAELDAWYLTGEGAPHADVYRAVADVYAALNRRERAQLGAGFTYVNHLFLRVEQSDVAEFVRTRAEQVPDVYYRVDAVHRLAVHGAVVSIAWSGKTSDGFEASGTWIDVSTVRDGLLDHMEVYPQSDLDAALARFEELRPGTLLDNAATRAHALRSSLFARRDWDALDELFAADFRKEDRRPGLRASGDDHTAGISRRIRGLADLGVDRIEETVLAIRGDRLSLHKDRFVGRDSRPDAYYAEQLQVVEVDADGRWIGLVAFEPEGIDAAFAELDARYLAGEAAPHAEVWRAVVEVIAALNRGELATVHPDFEIVSHQPLEFAPEIPFARGLRATFAQLPDYRVRHTAVLALESHGAVYSIERSGTTDDGAVGSWAHLGVIVVRDGLVARVEDFPEEALDAALARFEELRPRPTTLANAATRMGAQGSALFAQRDWDALDGLYGDAYVFDDRRRGLRHTETGRAAEVSKLREIADLGVRHIDETVIAVRGDRLALLARRFVGRDTRADAFRTETLNVVEVDDAGRSVALVAFEPEDLDAAFAELDARYVAGEAAPHAAVWRAIDNVYAALNRREVAPLTDDFTYVNHLVLSVQPADLAEFLRTRAEQLPDVRYRVDAVHRIAAHGAVVSHSWNGTTKEGFEGGGVLVHLVTVRDGVVDHMEGYPDDERDAALARFEELRPRPAALGNAATHRRVQMSARFAQRDWDALGALYSDAYVFDDRRRGLHNTYSGGPAQVAALRGIADLGVRTIEDSVVAVRGERLALLATRYVGRDTRPDAFRSETLEVFEVDAAERCVALVAFDADDTGAAFAELEQRYIAGEAAEHVDVWRAVTDGFVGMNTRRLPSTNLQTIDHRGSTAIDTGQLGDAVRAMWELVPDIHYRLVAVHALDAYGAVVSLVIEGTGADGGELFWSAIDVFVVAEGVVAGLEIFNSEDLDAALARFEALRPQRGLDSFAVRVARRYNERHEAADRDELSTRFAEDSRFEDHRRGLAVVLDGRDALVGHAMTIKAMGHVEISMEPVATRGQRLVLLTSHATTGLGDIDLLILREVNVAGEIVFSAWFDPDDVGSAHALLDARYLQGEASDHAAVWRVMVDAVAGVNRRELVTVNPDVSVRPARGSLFSDSPAEIGRQFRSHWEQIPDLTYRIVEVHRLASHGATITVRRAGTTVDGSDVLWIDTLVFVVRDGLISTWEVFAVDDLDGALARFEELRS